MGLQRGWFCCSSALVHLHLTLNPHVFYIPHDVFHQNSPSTSCRYCSFAIFSNPSWPWQSKRLPTPVCGPLQDFTQDSTELMDLTDSQTNHVFRTTLTGDPQTEDAEQIFFGTFLFGMPIVPCLFMGLLSLFVLAASSTCGRPPQLPIPQT